MTNSYTSIRFDFENQVKTGVLIAAGGFEDRALTFCKKLERSLFSAEVSLILEYQSQKDDNKQNFQKLKQIMYKLTGKRVKSIGVHGDQPIKTYNELSICIRRICDNLEEREAIVDISGMTHLLATAVIHNLLSANIKVSVVYTEAAEYFPSYETKDKLVKSWKNEEYSVAEKYLQSAALKAIHILPEFSGNFRPGHQTCLIVFAGYEPNRILGLIDDYAPGSLIVLYGKSPHKELNWRTKLSKDLHKKEFSSWFVREAEISTFDIKEIYSTLEKEWHVISDQFDVVIAPSCSKMQNLASYLFWKRHPEVQLVFTSPVRFNPKNYSKGATATYFCHIDSWGG